MPQASNAYRVNEASVAQETLEGETIIINMDTGAYYSLEGSAGELWREIVRGVAIDALKTACEARYTSAPGQIAAHIDAFLADLLADTLLLPDVASGEAPQLDAAPQGAEFVAPELSKYTDFEDLLLLDPVHEVAETGWPSVK